MNIAFIGHLAKDINVVKHTPHLMYGGGVFHGSITAQRLGAKTVVYAKCAVEDRAGFAQMQEAGVRVEFLPSSTSTSIRNEYPSDNPDDRQSFLITRAAPYSSDELQGVHAPVVHVNPLWFGEFPPDLIPVIRKQTKLLAGDAQGFLRNVSVDGRLQLVDWPDKERYLPFFDLFKVDIREAEILTGESQRHEAVRLIGQMGAKKVLLTHQGGVCVFDGKQIHEASFGRYSMEGRTGRGDTCLAAFLVGLETGALEEATRFAARITSEKMQYRGPYRLTGSNGRS